MFDVIWTDPDRELVGEHRAKKEIAREQKRAKERSEDPRASLSTRASSSSSEKTTGFFGSRSLRKVVLPLRSRPTSNSSVLLAPAPSTRRSSRNAPQENTTTDAVPPLPDPLLESGPPSTRLTESHLQNEHMSYPSSRDSVISKWAERTAPTNLSPSTSSFPESTRSSIVQTLGPSSFITQNTEVDSSPRKPETDTHRLTSEVSICSGRAKDESLSLSHSREEETSADELDLPINLFPSPNSPSSPLSPKWTSSFKPNNPRAWKSPAAWNSTSVKTETDGDGNGEEDRGTRALDLRRMEQELEMMAAADPAIILERLRESWGDTSDASLYRELELERKTWMLSALHNMDQVIRKATTCPRQPPLLKGRPRKVLALYESQATASYLAAIHSKGQVYHLSVSPLPYALFPNIHPIAVPAVSAANLPVAPRIFSDVYSLSLPSLVSSQDIPHMLKGVHRCLMPEGTLHLTMIDPMPVASSLGPHMRAWIERHLLLNLEKNFRCVNPSKLFPHWLAESRLRGKGSTISTAKFWAVPPGGSGARGTPDARSDDRSIMMELRGAVGRMLWTEAWGMYVGAQRWWWEEPECVKECLQLGTHWEYYLIEGVKEG